MTTSKIKQFIPLIILILLTTQAQSSIVKTAGQYNQLEGILTANGFTAREANSLLRDKLVPHKWHLNPKDRFLLVQNKEPKRTELRFYLDYCDDTLVFWKTKDGEGIERRTTPLKTVIKTISGPIRGSISESITKQINDEWVVTRFTDAFVWDHNLDKRIQRNDRFKLVVEQKFDEGHLVKYGEVLEAELTLKGQTTRRLLISNNNQKFFVDPSNNFEDRPFYAPVDYMHISSLFNKRRFHPIRHRIKPHLGVDFALPEGSPIYAPRSGVVKEIGRRRGNGNFISLEHDQGFISIYNHLQSIHGSLTVGQKVYPGQVIGYVGSTGLSTSPHLHFAIRRGKIMYNPIQMTKPYPYAARDYKRMIAAADSQIDSKSRP